RSEGASASGEETDTPAKGARLPTRAPPWERVAKSETPLARLDRQANEPRGAENDPQLESPKPGGAYEPTPLPAPDLAPSNDPAFKEEPAPGPERPSSKLAAPAERSLDPIAEETAEARPASPSGSSGPARGLRGGPQATSAEVAKTARREI